MKIGPNDIVSLDGIVEELQKFSAEIISFNPPLKDDSVVSAFENKYGVTLPQDYKEFIKHYDGMSLMGTEIVGFSAKYNLVKMYEDEHFEVGNPQPCHLVPFSNDGYGNTYCFDTRKLNSVVFWQHDIFLITHQITSRKKLTNHF
jgi:hypothetical protein